MRKIFHGVGASGQGVLASHEFLVEGEDLDSCTRKMLHFFENYQLVKYGKLEISEAKSLPAHAAEFWQRIEAGEEKNRHRIRAFLDELSREGVTELAHLETLPQGYQSKTLHTLTHLLDGFFGIDSHFFNLPEGSHSVSPDLKKKIAAAPGSYMLLSIRASI